MAIKICGTGSCLPRHCVSNDDLSRIMDTSDEWIRSRTGIETRHLVTEETTTFLSTEAAKSALSEAKLAPEEIDLILAATITPDHVIPSLACEVQRELGAVNAVAFDICAACSGFLFALNTAYAYLKSGQYKNALVIGAETLSKIMDWEDRSTCVLFGDGAGAAVIKEEPGDAGIKSLVQGSDGARGEALRCDGRPIANPYVEQTKPVPAYVHMDGQAVYKFAVRTVPDVISRAIREAGIEPDQVDHFVLHQANIRIIESVAKRLHQPIEKFPANLQKCGNISAASVPILLDDLNKSGRIKRGDTIVLAGFGGGLTWGAAVLTW